MGKYRVATVALRLWTNAEPVDKTQERTMMEKTKNHDTSGEKDG